MGVRAFSAKRVLLFEQDWDKPCHYDTQTRGKPLRGLVSIVVTGLAPVMLPSRSAGS